MYMPFPVLTPRLIDSKWFNADYPCDDDAELAILEIEHKQGAYTAIVNSLTKKRPLGKVEPEAMDEEPESDEEEGNDESEESEDTHDEDDEEDHTRAYSPTRNNNEIEPYSIAELNL